MHDVLLLERAVPWHRQLLGDACPSEGHVEEIVARLELELCRTAFRTGKQRQLAVGARRRMETSARSGRALSGSPFSVSAASILDAPPMTAPRHRRICRCIFWLRPGNVILGSPVLPKAS
jgi:hypothetical protein